MEKPGVNEMGGPEAPAPRGAADVYFLFVAASNLVTALVPSETACLASSPWRSVRRGVAALRAKASKSNSPSSPARCDRPFAIN